MIHKWKLVLLTLLLTSCAPPTGQPVRNDERTAPNVEYTILYDSGLSALSRVVDAEFGVVCYIYSSVEKGGIDCLELKETSLSE